MQNLPPFIEFDSDLDSASAIIANMIGPGGSECHKGIKYKTTDKTYHSKRRLQRPDKISVAFKSTEGLKQFPGELAFHFARSFLDTREKVNLCLATPVMAPYAKLRQEASCLTKSTIKSILAPLDHKIKNIKLCSTRSRQVSKLLLLCDFDVGKVIRLMKGMYTGDFLDYPSIDKTLRKLLATPTTPGQPLHNFDLLHQIYHDGAPSSGHYSCTIDDMRSRNLYDNHAAAKPHHDSIRPKVATDIQKSYAIAFPRWIIRFIDGILLAAVGWISRVKNGKCKGRQVNDPSAHITGPSDTGAVNDQIPDDLCPEVYYQTTFKRVLTRAFNLRISHPLEDIIAYKDDLVTAFRRVRYHPDACCAHSFVFEGSLIIPIGLVFRSRDSPSLFCQASEIRAFTSQHFSSLDLPIPDSSLIDIVDFSSEPPRPGNIHPAIPDSYQEGTTGTTHGPHNTFVDDNIMIELRTMIRSAALFSILTAVLFIGSPLFVEEPISAEKFEKYFSHINEILGFVLDTRKMMVSYPLDKKEDLPSLLTKTNGPLDQATM